MTTRYRQNEDGTLQIVVADGTAEGKAASDGAAEGKEAPDGAAERKEASNGSARWRRGLRRAAYVAGLVAICVTLVIGWGVDPLAALCAPALPCLGLFVVMLLYGLHPEEEDEATLNALLAFNVAWLCLLAATVALVSNTEAVLMALMLSFVMESVLGALAAFAATAGNV